MSYRIYENKLHKSKNMKGCDSMQRNIILKLKSGTMVLGGRTE